MQQQTVSAAATAIAGLAVLASSIQGWISYQALSESRMSALAIRRVEACAAIGTAMSLAQSGDTALDAQQKLEAELEVLKKGLDELVVLSYLGPDNLQDIAEEMYSAMKRTIATSGEAYSIALENLASHRASFNEACRSVIYR